jgi:hypothetical protein
MFESSLGRYLNADGNSTATTLLRIPFAMSTLAPTLPQIRSYGHDLDMAEDKIGLIRDSSDAENDFDELRRRFDEDGYLYMKGYLGRDNVLEARREITVRLNTLGMLHPDHPGMDGVMSDDYGAAFHPTLSENNAPLRNVLYGERLTGFYEKFLRRGHPSLRLHLAARHASGQWYQPALRPALHGTRHAPPHDRLGSLWRHLLRTRRIDDSRKLLSADGSAQELRLPRRRRLLRKQTRTGRPR